MPLSRLVQLRSWVSKTTEWSRPARANTIATGLSSSLDHISQISVVISGLIVFTTIQAQDFADVEGDKRLGRVTFPIYAPQFSRLWTLLAMVAWTALLTWFWSIGPTISGIFLALGTAIGFRFYYWRNEESDKLSYILYNVSVTRYIEVCTF